MRHPDTGLIVINQSVSPAFMDWIYQFSAIYGNVELWSGNADDDSVPGLTVIRLTPYDKSSNIKRLLTWAQFTWQAISRLFRIGGRTPLLIVTNPPFMPVAGWACCALQSRRYTLLEWDIYPQVLAVMGLISPQNLLYRLWRIGHARALCHADAVITIGNGLADELRRIVGNSDFPICVIPNWVNTDWLKPLAPENNSFVREQHLEGKQVVLYSGNIGSTHSIETILESARLLTDEPRLIFVIIGDGSKRRIVKSAIESGKTPNVRLLPLQPTYRLPLTLSSGHIGIVTLQNGYEHLSMPSKTYSMMAAGNAILGISQPPNDLAATIRRYGCGANFRPDDPAGISAWIRHLLDNDMILSGMRNRSRRAAVTEFSANRWVFPLNEIISKGMRMKKTDHG